MATTTRQQREIMLQDAIRERVARGMNYSEAYAVVMSLPEFQTIVAEMEKPAEVVFPRLNPNRAAEIAAAVKKLQDEFGYGYDEAFSKLRFDPKFANLFETESSYGQRD